jgi:hypothetical protein
MPGTSLQTIRARILIKILPKVGWWIFLLKPEGLVLAKNRK